MTQLVAWRISNQRWSRWHLTTEPHFTVCGHEIPEPQPWGGPTYYPAGAPESHRKIANACRTCRQVHAFTRETER